MILHVEQPVALICLFTWIGFVGGISFLEAWIKFRAPGVTLPIGLGIGRLVFHALNKVEWAFALAVTASTLWNYTGIISWSDASLLLVLFILIMQTCWLLPRLDARAESLISNKAVGSSRTHVYFVAAECLKVILLFVMGIHLFRS